VAREEQSYVAGVCLAVLGQAGSSSSSMPFRGNNGSYQVSLFDKVEEQSLRSHLLQSAID
jgi:hypothetical protein